MDLAKAFEPARLKSDESSQPFRLYSSSGSGEHFRGDIDGVNADSGAGKVERIGAGATAQVEEPLTRLEEPIDGAPHCFPLKTPDNRVRPDVVVARGLCVEGGGDLSLLAGF